MGWRRCEAVSIRGVRTPPGSITALHEIETLAKRSHSDHPSGGDAQSRCKHFTSVSPDPSGHFLPTVGAPMLGRSPLADMVSSKQAPTRELWIRRPILDA